MRKDEAITLVKQTLGDSFDEACFKRFTTELLKDYEHKDQVREGQYIKHAFQGFVLKYKILGTFTDPAGETLDILEVALGKNSSLELARTAQRNFVADYLKSSNRKAALVAFVRPKFDDWRLSLVRLDHTLEVVDEKLKVKQEITPARRWSFLVGKTEGSHTAQSRFTDILTVNEKPTIEELQEAFSIETVTDEFFEKYKELFLQLKDHIDELMKRNANLRADFESKEISTADFAKKTLGQIVFLYFLQKKGWFGVAPGRQWGEGPKRFIRELFIRREKYGSNFFNDVLEPLFYEALAQDRGKESLYPRLNNCRMPFLNGGLFEPMNGYQWEITNITIPDEMFSNTLKTKEGDEGTGILDVFDRYNFTVNENEPLEKEVAVDPEMLGKVFENLLEINDRKDKGAFYTPREIVHYMCQESLITYLNTNTGDIIPKEDIETFIRKGDRIIENDKIALEKIREKENRGFEYKGRYELLLPDSIITNAEQLDQLLKEIKVADPAVGSGAFPLGMINEIVRARKVLNIYLDDIVSDYELKLHTISHSIYGVDIDPGAVEIARLRLWLSLVVEESEPRPLPNLEHKIMQGNSLVSEYEGIKLFDPQVIRSKALDVGQQGTLPIGGIDVAPQQGTLGISESDSKLRMQELTTLIDRYIGESQRSKKQSLKSQIDQLKWELIEATLREKGEGGKLKKVAELRRKNIRPFFLWELEFSDVFIEKEGFDVVIGNPPYIRPHHIDPETKLNLWNEYRPIFQAKSDIYACFMKKGIDLARNNGTVGYIVSRTWLSLESFEELRKYILNKTRVLSINITPVKTFKTATVETLTFLFQKVNSKELKSSNEIYITKYTEGHFKMDRKIKQAEYFSTHLHAFDLSLNRERIDFVSKLKSDTEPLKDCAEFSYGIKTGDDAKFISKDCKSNLCKKLIRRSDFSKYSISWKGECVLYDPDAMKRNKKTARPGTAERFETKKLLVQDIAKDLICTIDNCGFYVKDALIFHKKEGGPSLEYLLALLNSSLMKYIYTKSFENLSVSKNAILSLPIKTNPPKELKEELEKKVGLILDKYFENVSTENITSLDEIVMDLYELTEEEKEIIRNS